MVKVKGEKRERMGSRKVEVLSSIVRILAATIAVPTVAVALAVLPNAPIALEAILGEINQHRSKKRYLRPAELRRLFEQLKRDQLINIQETEDDLKISIRTGGVRRVIINNLNQLKFTAPKNWDGRWRLVVFDIPERHRQARNAFVAKLHELSFYPLQKSVFAFPYPPADLIDFLSSILEIRPYVRLIEATVVDGEAEILAHFKLKR